MALMISLESRGTAGPLDFVRLSGLFHARTSGTGFGVGVWIRTGIANNPHASAQAGQGVRRDFDAHHGLPALGLVLRVRFELTLTRF